MRTLAILLGTAAAFPAAAEFTLTILHTNDVHSRIEPINRFDSSCGAEDDAAGECFGGAARIKTMMDILAGNHDNPLILDAGDPFQGTLFYTQYKGAVAAETMAAIGYQAMAVGNHEFDDGPETLARFADAVPFPVVSGNIDVSRSNALAGKISDRVVIDVNGTRVGIVSALAVDTPETSSPGPDVIFSDAIESLTQDVAELTAEGVDIVIALNHVGFARDLEIAAQVPGLDAVIGGHSHTLLEGEDYPTMVEGPGGVMVPVAQAYAYSKYIGELVLEFDADGVVTAAHGQPVLLDASVAPDADLAARIAELAAPLEAIRQEVVGAAAEPIDGERTSCRARECEMGNLVADAMLARVADQGIDVAIQNGGGLRASIDAGDVTLGEVLTVLPFQNTLATFQLSGADIVAALENGVGAVEEGAGRFPQVAGMSYAFDLSQPAGSRVSDVMVAGAPIDLEATYGVVSNNYMRGGGDGYAMFVDAANAYDFGPNLEEVVADYLFDNSPYSPYLDGRIAQK